MPIVDPPLTVLRARLRACQDASLLALTRWPVVYGSPEYDALPAEHPDRQTALQRAADAWRAYWQPDAVAVRRAAEADRIAAEIDRRWRALSHDLAGAGPWPAGPTHAELARLRYPWLHDPAWQSPYATKHGRDWLGTDNGDHLTDWLTTHTNNATARDAA